MWRRSLQLRVVVSTLALSFVVLLILGFVLMSQITDRLLEVKLGAATEEVERARVAVERDLASGDGNTSVQNRLRQTRSLLTDRDVDTSQTSGSVGTFDSVLIVPRSGSDGSQFGVGPISGIPRNLRDMVQGGQVAYQYTRVADGSGGSIPALVIGTPTNSSVPGLELYLVFPLTTEQNTVDLVRGTLLTGGAGLVLKLKHALFDKLVYSKVREAMGGRCSVAITGGGALGETLTHFYRGIGLTIYEGYGLTETSAAITARKARLV